MPTLVSTLHPKESASNLSGQPLKLVHLSVWPPAKTEDDLMQGFLVREIPTRVVQFVGKPSMCFPWDIVVSATDWDYLRTLLKPDFAFTLAAHPICPTGEAWKTYGNEDMAWEQGWRIFTINTHQAFLRNHMIGACYCELAILCNTHGFLAINLFYHELAVSSCHILCGGLIDI